MPTFLEYGWSIGYSYRFELHQQVGQKTPHIGTFWSGCASSMKYGLEIIGLALVDVYANSCMMLRAHQTPSTGELKLRNMTLVQHYIAVIKRYKKEFLKVTDIVVADAFFSIRPFVDGIKEYGFHLVSRFSSEGRPDSRGAGTCHTPSQRKMSFTEKHKLNVEITPSQHPAPSSARNLWRSRWC